MSDKFRKNLMGPEPTLLPAETEIYQHLALGVAGDPADDGRLPGNSISGRGSNTATG